MLKGGDFQLAIESSSPSFTWYRPKAFPQHILKIK